MIDIRVPPRAKPRPVRADTRLIEELARLRGRSELSTRQQATQSGVSMSCTHEWYHGTNRPTLDAFERALNVLGYRLEIVRTDQ